MKLKKQIVVGVVVLTLGGTGMISSSAFADDHSPSNVASSTESFSSELQSALEDASPETVAQAQRAINASQRAAAGGSAAGGSATTSGGASPAAAPAVRVAVKAAMEVVKRTAPKLWQQIQDQVKKGKTAFVKWWDSSVPRWVKDMLVGISGAAVYDALMWLLGLG